MMVQILVSRTNVCLPVCPHAGWDFVGVTANGTQDIWRIDEGKDYPRLWWEAK